MYGCVVSEVHDDKFSAAIPLNQAPLIDTRSDLSKAKAMHETRRRRGKRERTREELEDLARLKTIWRANAHGRHQKDLAEAYGVSAGAISQYFTGETAINWPFLRVVSEFLGVDPTEISPRIAAENMLRALPNEPLGSISVQPLALPTPEAANVRPYIPSRPARPVVARVIAGNFRDAIPAMTPGYEPWLEHPRFANPSEQAVWLIVDGDSMDDGTSNGFREGDLILVDPEAPWESGDFVIIANGGDEWTFKRIRKDGPTWFMEALNPGYQPRVREIPEGWRVVAKVVEVMPKGRKVG